MKSVSKTFTYQEYEFKIEVEFNTKAERHPNGKRWHTVNVYSPVGGLLQPVNSQYVVDSELENFVTEKETILRAWADKQVRLENPLKHLGYR
jgi:hypothetical protein